jgi:ATP-binding cassette subfamily B protein
MFTVHWQLALITTIIVPLMTWLVSKYGSRMTSTWQQLFRQVGDFNTRVQESVGGIRVVKAFANEDYERGCSPRTTRATAPPSSAPMPS